MMSVETIIALEREQAVKAAYYELAPYVPADAEEPLTRWEKRIPLPNIGSFRPDGWSLVKTEEVEKGWGGPFMSIPGLRTWVSETVKADPTAGFAIVSETQWTVTIAYFTQNPDIKAEEGEGAWVNGFTAADFEIEECYNCGQPVDVKESKICPDCGYDPDACEDCGENPCRCKATWRCPNCDSDNEDYKSDEKVYCQECGGEFTWDETLTEEEWMRVKRMPNFLE